jgi:glycosyltransferase involved in cell wall biosynthesis
LNSIFNQQYREYQVVISDAESSDETVPQIQQYLSVNEQFKERTRLMPIEGKSHAFAVLSAARSCREDSLVVMLDGNTELIGK